MLGGRSVRVLHEGAATGAHQYQIDDVAKRIDNFADVRVADILVDITQPKGNYGLVFRRIQL